MDNQHRQIKGYSELGQEEIDLMNEVKAAGVTLEALTDKVRMVTARFPDSQRWTSVGVTHFQQGLMALTRAVAKPEFF